MDAHTMRLRCSNVECEQDFKCLHRNERFQNISKFNRWLKMNFFPVNISILIFFADCGYFSLLSHFTTLRTQILYDWASGWAQLLSHSNGRYGGARVFWKWLLCGHSAHCTVNSLFVICAVKDIFFSSFECLGHLIFYGNTYDTTHTYLQRASTQMNITRLNWQSSTINPPSTLYRQDTDNYRQTNGYKTIHSNASISPIGIRSQCWMDTVAAEIFSSR